MVNNLSVAVTGESIGEMSVFMSSKFTKQMGEKILDLVLRKDWKVCYEYRRHGEGTEYQSLEEVYAQEAETLDIGPRYHVFPGPLSFDKYSRLLILDRIQIPMVTIEGERRVLFGFGLREDDCFFVTNTDTHAPSADRIPKTYEFVLEALETLEPFDNASR